MSSDDGGQHFTVRVDDGSEDGQVDLAHGRVQMLSNFFPTTPPSYLCRRNYACDVMSRKPITQIWPNITANHLRDCQTKSKEKAVDSAENAVESTQWDTPGDASKEDLEQMSNLIREKMIEAGIVG